MEPKTGTMRPIGTALQTRDCPVCGRVFLVLADRCQVHCSAPCCRKGVGIVCAPENAWRFRCGNAKPTVRSLRSTRTCSVCHRPRWMFERFAPCSDECTLMRYRSTRLQVCMVHRPTAKPRIHIDYCSFEHYTDWYKGHLERARAGRRVRWRRHSAERLSQARFRREKARG